jgi:hypothetical protein
VLRVTAFAKKGTRESNNLPFVLNAEGSVSRDSCLRRLAPPHVAPPSIHSDSRSQEREPVSTLTACIVANEESKVVP